MNNNLDALRNGGVGAARQERLDNPRVSVMMPVMIEHAWQLHMTECAIKTLHATTQVPFELVVVETGKRPHIGEDEYLPRYVDVYIHHPERTTIVKDMNAALEKCTGDYIVHTANDIFTKPGWLEALIDVFRLFPDAGIATLASSDLKQQPMDCIMEGIYGPLMMFRNTRENRFDEDYENIFSDSDLIMRVYKRGLRSYRNWRVCVTHLYQQTYQGAFTEQERLANFEKAKQIYAELSSSDKNVQTRTRGVCQFFGPRHSCYRPMSV